MLWLSFWLACGPKKAPEPTSADPAAQGAAQDGAPPPRAQGTPGSGTVGQPEAVAERPAPSTPPGPPGSPLDPERAERLRGSWVDQSGVLLKLPGADTAVIGGQTVSVLALFCAWGEERVPCLGLEATPQVMGDSRLLILAQTPDGRLEQVNVGPFYTITGAVPRGQVFRSLEGRGAGAAAPKDQRLILGQGGTPLFCTSEGAASLECVGFYHAVELLPMYSPVVERSQVVLSSTVQPQGCDGGVRVTELLGAQVEHTLALGITPVLPREDDLARITKALRAAPTDVRAAWRLDLDGDRRDELLFEVAVPVGAGGQPPRAAVGVLSGDQVVVLSSREGRNALDTAPSVQVKGLVDPFGDGALAVMLYTETDRLVAWELTRYTPQGPRRVYGLSC